MIAAIYARIEHARAYATAKGWAVSDDLIFVDDGISGAIFGDGRPGLMRLLNALNRARASTC
jgi:DNA invertase Pin-like site-specific DNA recombinase